MTQVLSLAFGRELGGILETLGEVMQPVGMQSAFLWTLQRGLTLEILTDGRVATQNWVGNAFAFSEATKAALAALEQMKPEGDDGAPNLPDSKAPGYFANQAEGYAYGILQDVIRSGDTVPQRMEVGRRLREALGPEIIARIKTRIFDPDAT